MGEEQGVRGERRREGGGEGGGGEGGGGIGVREGRKGRGGDGRGEGGRNLKEKVAQEMYTSGTWVLQCFC